MEIPFDWLLGEVTDKHGVYEFVLSEPGALPELQANHYGEDAG